MRNILTLLGLLVLLAGGVYYGSPYYTVWKLEQAAKGDDAHAIEGYIDFPAVRANLSPELSTAFQTSVDVEQKKPHSIFDRIGMAIAPLFHRRAADILVTPEGLAVMLKTASAPRYANPFHQGREPDSAHPGEPYTKSQDYIDHDLDQFRVVIGNRLKPRAELTLRLLRRGFITWKVTAIDLGSSLRSSETTPTRPPSAPE